MEHSASRRLEVLAEQAPHLIAAAVSFPESRRLVRQTAGTLRLALATARREGDEHGRVSDDVWSTIDALTDELVWRLAELERAERALSSGRAIDGSRFVRTVEGIPPERLRP